MSPSLEAIKWTMKRQKERQKSQTTKRQDCTDFGRILGATTFFQQMGLPDVTYLSCLSDFMNDWRFIKITRRYKLTPHLLSIFIFS